MDGLTLALLLAGVLTGVLTGLLPGLHVNTLAAVGLAVLPAVGLPGLLFILAVGTVHTVVNILPATFLGVPDEDDVLVMLPAHRLLQEGRGQEAVMVSAAASLLAVLIATALHPVYTWLLVGPPGLLGRLDAVLPVALGIAALALIVSERHRGLRGLAWAVALLGLSGILGLWALDLPVRSWLPVPPTPLLPLLGGLFGAPGLVVALRSGEPLAVQAPPRRQRLPGRPVAAGIALAGITAVLPGVTGAVATTLAPRRREEPLDAVAALSAINTAHAVLAVQVLWIAGRVRTGLAEAAERLVPGLHAGAAATGDILATLLLAGACGALATVALAVPMARHADRLPSRALAAATLGFLVLVVVAATGPVGLGLFVVAALLGLVPLAAGVRRVHLAGCLLVPVFTWSL